MLNQQPREPKIKLSSATQAIVEMAEKEFVTTPVLKEIKGVFGEVTYGSIEITVVDGEIENIKVTKNYKPISSVDEE